MYKLLVITDDPKLGREVRDLLTHAGHAVQVAGFLEDQWHQAASDQPPLAVIADLRDRQNEPKPAAGLNKDLAALGLADLPLLAIIGRTASSRLRVLPGVTDLLLYPFTDQELLLRTRRAVHLSQQAEDDNCLRIGGLLIDQDAYRVTVDGKPVELTFKEYELLRHLASRRGRAFSREALLSQVWGFGYYGGTRTVDVHIRRVRNKIGPVYGDLIRTVRNVGYRFDEDRQPERTAGHDIFLAGVMQGSSLGSDLHDQDYRERLKDLFQRYAPGAVVFDPFAKHQNSIEYDDDEGRSVFLRHLEVARSCKLVVCYLPTASMGTAIEIWEAYHAGCTIWTVSPLDTNWVVRFFSHKVFADLDQLEAALAEGATDSLGLG